MFKSRLSQGFLIGVLVSFLTFFLYLSGIFRGVEYKFLDINFFLRGSLPPDPRIVILAVDEESLRGVGKWPWPWRYYEIFLERLKEAKVIAFDILFSEPEPGEEIFVQAIQKAGNVFLPFYFSDRREEINPPPGLEKLSLPLPFPTLEETLKGFVFPLPALTQAAKGVGHINVFQEWDGVVRKIPLLIKYKGRVFPSLSLSCAREALGLSLQEIKVEKGGIWLGENLIPLTRREELWINFQGGEKTFPYLSASLLWENKIDPSLFKDKIVLIGATAPGLSDFKATPFTPSMSGVEIHAHVLHNLLRGDPLKPFPSFQTFLLLLLGGMFLGFVVPRSSPFKSALWVFLFVLGESFLGFVFFFFGIWFPTFSFWFLALSGYTSITLHRLFREEKEERFIRETFSRYVSPEVVEELLKNPGKLTLGGERKRLTVLFADIRGFTRLCEHLGPEEVVDFLNRYFDRLVKVVFEEGGMVDKFIGDELMAIFGAPLYFPDHPLRAVSCALKMQKEIKKLERVQVGIGINTGEMIVGNIGTFHRIQYTVVGDAVNIASRLQSLAGGGEILVSESTFQEIKDYFITQKAPLLWLKGKEKPVKIYQVTGVKK